VIEVSISPPILEESTFDSPASIKSIVALLPKKREDLALEDVEITELL
jgi:hypothetical protein